jgi:hypothetical protein
MNGEFGNVGKTWDDRVHKSVDPFDVRDTPDGRVNITPEVEGKIIGDDR